jgi:AAA family ATP:ADP antiporter
MNLMLVSVFWSFMLEILTSEQTRRLFGLIAAGGTAGALVGPLLTSLLVTRIGNSGVLYLGAVLFIAAVFLQRVLMAQWRRIAPQETPGASQLSGRDRALGGNPFAGIMLVARNPYLIGIMLFVVGVSAINTFLYFEQLQLVEEQFAELTKRTQVFANMDAIVQSLVIVSQLTLTGYIATRLGLTVLLVTVPIVMVFGLSVFAISGTFVVLALAMILRRWGEYAFIRPGREMLWSRLDTETKYKAKNFVDVTVYRFSDAVVAQVQDALKAGGMNPTQGALLGAAVCAAWAVNGWWLGRRFDKEKEQKTGA